MQLYEKAPSAGQPARVMAPQGIMAAMSTSTGQVTGTQLSACFDGNLVNRCAGVEDKDPSLTISFNCTETGTALGSLSSVVIYMANGTNSSAFELVLRDRAGNEEQVLNFTSIQAGQQKFAFSLNSSDVAGRTPCW